MQKAFNKYGENNFIFEIIEVVEDKKMLDQMEIKYIEEDLIKGTSYNMLHGGGGRRGFKMKESAKKLVGEKNRQHMKGKKHSEETKKKMSEVRTGMTYSWNRKTTLINEKIAKIIKERLMLGEAPKSISDDLNISYHIVNGILSNDAWSAVKIEGWDNFQKTRKRQTRLTQQEKNEIYELHKQKIPIKQIAEKYKRHRHTIGLIIKQCKANDNPVPSLN